MTGAFASLALAHALDPMRWAADRLGFRAEPWQVPILRSLALRLLLNITRQGGKSTLAAIVALHLAVHRPGSLVLLVAPSLRQSGELHRKVRAFLERLDPRPELVEDSASTIALANGSRVVCVPASEVSARGFSAPALVVLDDAARIPDEAVAAIRPMLASGGRLWMLSTPAGQRGAFHQAATEHADLWEVHEVPAADVQHIAAAFLEEERRVLGPRAFAQEYCCSFEATDAALFDHDQLRAPLDDTVPPLFSAGGAAQLGGLLSNAVPTIGEA